MRNFFFEKFSNIKLKENLSGGNQIVPCGQMDGRTDMTKLMVAFHSFANAPKKLRRSRNTVGI